MFTIDDVARIITEDPDVNLETVWLEAAAETYLNYFNKSSAPLFDNNNQVVMGDWTAQHNQVTGEPHGRRQPLALKELTPEQKLAIIERIQAVIAPALVRYEQYFVRQVATGHLRTSKIEEDSERLNNTIALFIKFSRKATWEGSKSILDYPDWQVLERRVREHEDKHIEYDAADSEVLFKKSYQNNVMSLLLGGPPEVYTYWFRSVTTQVAACKYGKGTQWCTSSLENDYAASYIKSGGLYIVELQTPTKTRHPVLQISGEDVMDPTDTPISRLGPRMKDFFNSVCQAAAGKIREETLSSMENNFDVGIKDPYPIT